MIDAIDGELLMQHDFPTSELQELASPAVWNRLAGVSTQTATSVDESMDNVRINIERKLPWFHDFLKPKTESSPSLKEARIALVGGGPSIKATTFELIDFTTTIACGSSHDWLQEHSPRKPSYCVVCDPDPVMANYLRCPNHDTTYLVSSHCNPSVFDALVGHEIVMWHCWPIGSGNDEARLFLNEKTPGWCAVGGGCTVGLRSLSIALMMGYKEIHFFGFDSCLGMSDDDHHAYPFTDTTKEFLGDIYDLMIGMGSENGPVIKKYRVAGYQLAQAEHYKQMLQAFGHLFKPVFHGPGLITDMQAMIDIEAERLLQEELSK